MPELVVLLCFSFLSSSKRIKNGTLYGRNEPHVKTNAISWCGGEIQLKDTETHLINERPLTMTELIYSLSLVFLCELMKFYFFNRRRSDRNRFEFHSREYLKQQKKIQEDNSRNRKGALS